jgi:hypothetical protein
MIHFKQRLLPNCLPHDLEIVTVNGGDSTSQYDTLLAVAKFTGKQKKIKSDYFIATPRTSGYRIISAAYTVTPVMPTRGITELPETVNST